jgi:hypothetical protein
VAAETVISTCAGHLAPHQALLAQLKDLIGGSGICGRTTTRHSHPDATQLLTDRRLREAQIPQRYASGPGHTSRRALNVHGDTVTIQAARRGIPGGRT